MRRRGTVMGHVLENHERIPAYSFIVTAKISEVCLRMNENVFSSSPKGVLKKEDRFVKIRGGRAGAGVIHVRRFYLAAFFVVALLHQEAFLNLLP